MSSNHVRELEEAAHARVEEVAKLRAAHIDEVTTFAKEKSNLIARLSDLDGEVSTLKATMAAEATASPKVNGSSHPAPAGTSREDLQRLHEAHNLKMHDLTAAHDKQMKAMREQLDAALDTSDQLKEDIARKAMEIQYLETEHDEAHDEITRYVRIFGLKSFCGSLFALAVIYLL